MTVSAESSVDSPPPTPAISGRLYGLDVARAFAILGMIVVHFTLVMGADRGGSTSMTFVLGFLDGRAAATFVILAGMGVTLMSRRAMSRGEQDSIATVRRVLVRRGVFLLVVGFINLRIWPGDILRVYGVSLLLASQLISASNRQLILSVATFSIGFIVLLFAMDFGQNWEWDTMKYHGLWTISGLTRNLFYDGFRSVFPWTGFLIFGMWLGRLDMRNPAVNMRILIAAASTALFAEFVSWMCVSYLLEHPYGESPETIKALFGTSSMPALPLFLLASGGTAVAGITLCVRLANAWPVHLRPLAETGQLALTWYFAHIVLGLGTIVALDLENSQPQWISALCGVGFFVMAILFSWIWKRSFRHGPLEWVMRRVAG